MFGDVDYARTIARKCRTNDCNNFKSHLQKHNIGGSYSSKASFTSILN